MKATVFLGAGRITSALVAGLHLAGDRRPLMVHDRHPEKVRALRREFGVEPARDLKSAMERAEMLIIAVRPGGVADLLDEVAGCGARRLPPVAVSLAAGIPLKKLREQLGPRVRWARAMPSPVCRIGLGLTALAFDRGVPGPARKRVRQLFEQVGPVVDLPESRFDAFTAAFSPSHGYHALATLAKAAEHAGLDRGTALRAAAHALGDGITYWQKSGQPLVGLVQEAATPGGTAAAAMGAMNRGGYERILARGLAAAVGQARRNAKG